MKKEIIIRINYNGITIIHNNKIYYFELNNSVENHRVINSEKFTESLSNIIDKLKINHNFFSQNIDIIIDSTYSKEDKILSQNILKELSFNKIKYINITELLNVNTHSLTIELNEYNFKIYYLTTTYQGQIYFNKPLIFIEPYLKELISITNPKEIYIYGDSSDIKKLLNYIEKKYHIKTYYYSHPNIYPLEQLIY